MRSGYIDRTERGRTLPRSLRAAMPRSDTPTSTKVARGLSLQGLPEILPEVVGVFEADREADETGGNPLTPPLLGGLVAVAGGGGMAERGRRVPQAGREGDVTQGADEAVGLGPTAEV